MLVRVGGIVLRRDVVAEQQIRQRLEPVGMVPRNVESHGIVLADVGREDLAAPSVQDHHPCHPRQAREEIVLPALVEM